MTRFGSAVAATVLAVGFASAAQASWQDVASRHDQERLSRLSEARAKVGINVGESRPVTARELAGAWHCHTIRGGGILPRIDYTWFRCAVRDRGGHLSFEKLNGSQRVAGYLYPNGDGSWVLLGGWSVKGEPMHAYSGNGASVGAVSTPDDAVAMVSGTRSGVRIEFPYPSHESMYDAIEMRR
jgi:hypothetical protein